MTDTELKLIAAAAMTGLRKESEYRIQNSRSDRNTDGIVNKGEEKVLFDIFHDFGDLNPGPGLFRSDRL